MDPAFEEPSPPAEWLICLECDFGYTRFMNNNDEAYPSTKPTDRINVIANAFLPVALPAPLLKSRELLTL